MLNNSDALTFPDANHDAGKVRAASAINGYIGYDDGP